MPQERDYYEVLGVPTSATEKEIKAGFLRAAKQHHPDRNLDDVKGAEARFQEAEKAYSVLSDPQKRAAYDRFGTTSENNASSDYDPFGVHARRQREKERSIKLFEEALQLACDNAPLTKNAHPELIHYY